METQDLWVKMRELEEKARKYEHRKDVDATIVAQANAILEACNKLIGLLEPSVKLRVSDPGSRRRKTETDSTVQEIYEKIQAGTEVSSPLLQSLYGVPQATAQQWLIKVSRLPNVESRTGENRVKFYYRRHD